MRARILLWAISLLATAAAMIVTASAGFTIRYRTLLPLLAMTAVFAALQFVYSRLRPAKILADILGIQAAMLWALVMVGLIALAGLGRGAPLIDDALIRADAAFGLNAAATVTWLSHWPKTLDLLKFAYETSVQVAILGTILLCIVRRSEEAWRISASLAGSGLVCVIVAAFVPAVGVFVAMGLSPDTLARLPAGSGAYHLPVFEALRGRHITQIDVTMIEGVVTFPSFHAALAMAIAHVGLALGRFRAITLAWAALSMISAVPIGGHYFIDLICGALIYLAFAGIARSAPLPVRPVLQAPLLAAPVRTVADA